MTSDQSRQDLRQIASEALDILNRARGGDPYILREASVPLGQGYDQDWISRLLEALAALLAELDGLRAEVGSATNELHCCDDISLDKGLTVGISELQADRARLRSELDAARAERDEARASERAQADHVLRVAGEAESGFAALEEIDQCWETFGTPNNRKSLTLPEQIASTLRELDAAESSLAALKGEVAQISRMRLFPDDAVNRTTLLAAVKIARAALGEQKG